ncbi:MAG: hypothetical protein A2284_04085 [Deltaproteobacteria bacterium RIFOXYA12_FULL_61_11]|nr:MAG: hypothetical protein A2284_04085 [Deltaproteobacteria bacterium RIFOXYA12_FULL_61_11]
MTLIEFLEQHRSTLLERWFEALLATYPAEAVAQFAKNREVFTNPVGSTARRCLEATVEEFLGEADGPRLEQALEELVRVRAVQEFKPSEALDFAFSLRKVIEDLVHRSGGTLRANLSELEPKYERLLRAALDRYVASRDLLHDIRGRELRDRHFKMLERVEEAYGELRGRRGRQQEEPSREECP